MFRWGPWPLALLDLAVIVGIALLLCVPGSVWERLSEIRKLTSRATIAAADPEGSATQRFEIQAAGRWVFMDHPVLGVGPGAYPQATAMYAPDLGKRRTHNAYFNLADKVSHLVGHLL